MIGYTVTERFVDHGDPIYSFILDPVDVRCAECGERARLAPLVDARGNRLIPRRLTCASCGFTREHDGVVVSYFADGRDPCFGLPLWYRTSTGKGVLWAYHRAHLEDLRAYVASTDRHRSQNPTWSNRSYFGRLPAWVKSGKNRDTVVKTLDRMLADGWSP